MKVVVLGAGIIGVSTAWHLLERGYEVTVVERQSGPALETSFANAGQISVSYCEPWANRHAPLKLLQWMFNADSPLLFRPQWPIGAKWREGWQQWRWGVQFLAQCNDAAFARNVTQLVALGRYSHAALRELVQSTGIEYHRLERGIAHYFTDQKSLDAAGDGAALMQSFGVQRRVVSTQELLQIEPALAAFAHRIKGGTYTASDESGDAQAFTAQLAGRCAARGAEFLYGQDILRLEKSGDAINSVALKDHLTLATRHLSADSFVVACGSYSAPLLRSAGVDLPIYPGKGYSATLALLKPNAAPSVSSIDDERKIAFTRMGDQLRVAGTIELAGFDVALDTPLARRRCEMLVQRVEEVFPGVADTRTQAQGGDPKFWCGLRPATPTNIPFMGRTPIDKLWVNAGHGTLGWTHGAGSGKALAELISGERPETDFRFYGV